MELIKFQERKAPARYLGDGVYAIFDGSGLWLHANDHEDPTDRIYLEPEVFEALIDFNKLVRSAETLRLVKEANDNDN